ncbi:hypothetical protein A2572_03585 [Candidatus Collierbacteria bacterium RIFOXYD1_FULL_40_9]|uniref:Uncharacterized protein n=1 Tax=Candidatus Collierbacteria bacterium RIFOXYD1_FULL_40_9 TaxID=1817731 RepID=A0A1F5FTI9_9BACT|nr:MAG: hypothetical protein A2572_03585 [Candidatus Collierbacteria bacterium RIFOXYD1_FULL_40_9]
MKKRFVSFLNNKVVPFLKDLKNSTSEVNKHRLGLLFATVILYVLGMFLENTTGWSRWTFMTILVCVSFILAPHRSYLLTKYIITGNRGH